MARKNEPAKRRFSEATVGLIFEVVFECVVGAIWLSVTVAPLWLDLALIGGLVLLAATIAAMLWRRRRRHARGIREGLCVRCNYPLQGVNGNVCPKCGHLFDPQRIQTLPSPPEGV